MEDGIDSYSQCSTLKLASLKQALLSEPKLFTHNLCWGWVLWIVLFFGFSSFVQINELERRYFLVTANGTLIEVFNM